jgi:hypothetical protein
MISFFHRKIRIQYLQKEAPKAHPPKYIDLGGGGVILLFQYRMNCYYLNDHRW